MIFLDPLLDKTLFLQVIDCFGEPFVVIIIRRLAPPVEELVQRISILNNAGALILFRIAIDGYLVIIVR